MVVTPTNNTVDISVLFVLSFGGCHAEGTMNNEVSTISCPFWFLVALVELDTAVVPLLIYMSCRRYNEY